LTKIAGSLLCLTLALMLAGCGGGKRAAAPPKTFVASPPPPPAYERPEEEVLEEAIRGKPILPAEVAKLSNRLLAEGSSTFYNEQTMARLEILLTKTLGAAPKEIRYQLLRDLGIIHYHQKKFNLARQELQQANELNPRDARIHFYLARLAAQHGHIYQRQGLSKKAKGQFTLAANEMELARKLEPSNALYRQDVKQILHNERPQPPAARKK
jgi:tetratricopeptide (TPR) repeat protein